MNDSLEDVECCHNCMHSYRRHMTYQRHDGSFLCTVDKREASRVNADSWCPYWDTTDVEVFRDTQAKIKEQDAIHAT